MKRTLLILGVLAVGAASAAKKPFSLDGRESFSPEEVHEEILHLEGLIAADTDKDFGSTPELSSAIARMVNAAGKKGDRAYLPVFEEWSLATNAHEITRRCSAHAYVQVAHVDECVEFMRKILAVNDNKGYWRSIIMPRFLDKVEAAMGDGSLSDESLGRVLSLLAPYVQSPANSMEATQADKFMQKHCPGYEASV